MMPFGAGFGFASAIAPRVKTPSPFTVASNTAGRNGAPIGRCGGSCPGASCGMNPKYVM